ncbi:MAG: Glycosyl transferase group 1 [Microgenomates group bacterium GW2011_GWC1_39_7]|nr:MAG: Glycosyl transferase group 1 [Microgenomates group bacterium GW2011_GWC1_39_7]
MKLVYVANVRIPTGKAHGVQIMKMCEAFVDAGAEVELWAPTRHNIIKADPFDYFNVKRNFKIVKIPSLDLVRYGWLGFWIQKITFTFSSIIRAIFSEAGTFYARDELFAFVIGLFVKDVYWEAHTNAFVNRNIKIITISGGLKKFFMSRGVKEEKILVASDGVSLKDFEISASKVELRGKLGIPKDKFIVAYIGKYTTMGSKKGVDELIVAFSRLLKKHPPLFLLIVGINKSEVSGLEESIRKAGVGKDSYALIMPVSHKDVPMYLKLSDTLVMNYPLTEHFSLYMSPLKMFEYMASGTPIIASDLPSIREILNTENAILIKPDNNQELSSAITTIINDGDLAKKLSAQASSDVKSYTWTRRAEKILDFIIKK